MAKRKTPKKEKIVDLKPKAEKITDEQLKEVQGVVGSLNQCNFEVGSLESQKHELLHKTSEYRTQLTKMQAKFLDEYGTFDININDGTINYPKENGETDKKD
jgi:hypothetical protein